MKNLSLCKKELFGRIYGLWTSSLAFFLKVNNNNKKIDLVSITWALFTFVSGWNVPKVDQKLYFGEKTVPWRNVTHLKLFQLFLVWLMARITSKANYSENLKSFKSYPQVLGDQNYQKLQKFIKNYVFTVLLLPQK